MEQLPTQIGEQKKPKSFDVLASVDMYRFDLQSTGYIHPETRRRVYKEELSYIAEGINRPLYTEFALNIKNDELVYFHEGKWQSYLGSLAGSLEVANQEAAADPRRLFQAERAAEDLRAGYQISGLQPGEKLVFMSDFPERECERYGSKFIGDLGFQPDRKMGFIYEAEKTMDGAVILRSQTVDGNDPEAYAAALDCGSSGGSIGDMLDAYDEVMQAKYGGKYFAGRQMEREIPEENAWTVIIDNKDLIEDYYLAEIEELARKELPRQELEKAKKRLTYGVWARLKERLEDEAFPAGLAEINSYGGYALSIQQQVDSAYQAAVSRGEVLYGCGGAITGEEALLNASSKDVFEMMFGNKTGKVEKMNCPFCGSTQYGDPCSPNQFCSACEARVENGQIKSKGKWRKTFADVIFDSFAEWNRRYDAEQAAKKAKEKR